MARRGGGTTNGGFVVWQDNATDGSGWGVSARRLDGTLSGALSTFRVNVQGTNDQENPRVALLKNGGAVFVWQGGVEGFQHIYARFLTSDQHVADHDGRGGERAHEQFSGQSRRGRAEQQQRRGRLGSFDQAGSNSLQDVYGQIISPTGQTIGNEFLVNQFTTYNQRTPAVAALAGGGFVVRGFRSRSGRLAAWLGINNSDGSVRGHDRCGRAWTFMRGFTTAAAPRRATNFS